MIVINARGYDRNSLRIPEFIVITIISYLPDESKRRSCCLFSRCGVTGKDSVESNLLILYELSVFAEGNDCCPVKVAMLFFRGVHEAVMAFYSPVSLSCSGMLLIVL